MKSKIIILCLVEYYTPGFRAGGPIRSIANFVEYLGDEFDIRIICRDRDFLDYAPYQNIRVDEWNEIGKAKVFYASKKSTSFLGIKKLLSGISYDILYLNSFFSFTFSILILLIRRLGIIKIKPCVIAPRGEFSKAALKLKKYKKKFYLSIVKYLNLYNNLHWQVSSEFELLDISKNLGKIAKNINIVPDLVFHKKFTQINLAKRKSGPLRIIFLSRITPMKNLDFLLKVLKNITTPLELGIFGPKVDKKYWKYCKELISKLPSYIIVHISDEISPNKVQEIFGKYDLFAFPTRGENFGHVISESLFAGTPVLLSDKTKWKPDKSRGLQTLKLNLIDWKEKIEEWANLSEDNLIALRQATLIYADKIFIDNKKSLYKNKKLFFNLISVN